jgi:hypothetical protein
MYLLSVGREASSATPIYVDVLVKVNKIQIPKFDCAFVVPTSIVSTSVMLVLSMTVH